MEHSGTPIIIDTPPSFDPIMLPFPVACRHQQHIKTSITPNLFSNPIPDPFPSSNFSPYQASAAYQDIDNLRCQQTSPDSTAIIRCGDPHTEAAAELTRVTYALKTLLVAGQCFQNAGTGNDNQTSCLSVSIVDL